MYIHIDRGVKKNCWNLRDSYGEICVGCGCCSSDKATRYASRLACSKEWLAEEEGFDNWFTDSPNLYSLQRENHKKNLQYHKRRIRYYERKLKEIGNG